VTCDLLHLSRSGGRIGDEVEDELRQRTVEAPVGEGERLSRPDPDVRAGNIRTAPVDERPGRVGSGNVIRADELGQDRVSAPVPQPTSTTRSPAATPVTRANSCASGRL
jgi:hypothetical protein